MTDLSRIESFQYPAAHYGHLTDNQQQQLETFREIIQKTGYYTPEAPDGSSEASHDDETLLRYLRARRFDPQGAFKQFKDTEDWRKEHNVDNLFNTIEVEEYEQTRRLYPQWLGRRDKRGIPVFLFEVAPLNNKNISAYERQLAKAKSTQPQTRTKDLRLFALYESLTRFVLPLCSAINRKHPETPISQSNNIVDISGVGLKQFWNLKAHMQDASTLATAHYPETLDRIFIIGAPAFFPTVWGWIKRWFDPMTVSKIFILSSSNVFPTLSQYIDPDNIPKKYGGNLDFQWGNMPILEPEIEAAMRWESPATQNGKNTFPIGPMRWEKGENGAIKAVAVGSEDGKPRRRTIFTIPDPVNKKVEKGHPIPNTPLDEAELRLTSSGVHTQPPDTGDDRNDEQEPPSPESPSPTDTPKPSSVSGSVTPATAATSTTDDTKELTIRQGTSETRFGQQDNTHASGQLADGTPHTAVNDHGAGDKTVTMEPGTVGQAPKDVSVKPQEPPAPGYLDQAKQVAAQATSAVTSTVGAAATTVTGLVGGSKAEEKVEEKVPEKSPEEKETAAKIDRKEDPAIEDLLREKTATRNAGIS